jgi:hypothetical protein
MTEQEDTPTKTTYVVVMSDDTGDLTVEEFDNKPDAEFFAAKGLRREECYNGPEEDTSNRSVTITISWEAKTIEVDYDC